MGGFTVSEERILNGRYTVGELIGRGGMADVHLGVDQVLGRKVAIKLLRAEMARDPMVQARFRREAKAVAGLNHPNIVSVFDTGEEAHEFSGSTVNLPFIVMEYVRGRTLRDIIKAGEMTRDLAVEYVLGVLEALAHSHSMGIVHRDIKPANIMVTERGALKVMDFGIARALADSSSTMTQTQTVVGTAQYLSPEQARGESVDARTDLYSTGCLLYELFTGRPPFTGDSPVSVAYQHVGEKAPEPSALVPELDPIFDAVVLKALAKDREDRYDDAQAFGVALINACQGIALSPEELTASLPHAADQSTAAQDLATMATPALVSLASSTGSNSGDAEHTGNLEPVGEQHQQWAQPPMWEQSLKRELDERRAKSKRSWTIAISFILVFAMLVSGLFFYNWMRAEAERNAPVAVPTLTEMTQAKAESTLETLQLVPKVEDVFDEDVASGLVVASDPMTAVEVRKGSTVRLMVSKGPEALKLPQSLAGQSEAGARQILADMGFSIGSVSRVNDPDIPTDWLVGTTPEIGKQVKVGTTIDLILSTGEVTVPQLINLTMDEAKSKLDDPEIKLQITKVEEEDSAAKPGTIINQSPESGTTTDQGGTVTVTVAVKPAEPTPTPTPTPSETPAETPAETPTTPPASSNTSSPPEPSSKAKPSKPAKASKDPKAD
ncbi:Stk1 family PASTA domain-containing Ser/Thr kinase [Paeniglutamicibacter terrestris]|uniref:non-specific serine/threonine protein kinase n=1 Tax=Paeniglutamicibacter terrestris TaxID=2723403 RepID=A0ABX1G952_9MICC|nr:Stk1 family PASTA domain-containing Ser/Thr kinase [Paeniglutamicibacter terrestris]NKG22795.1 Stk1 family PASTA domain-containing Ser/Thr kinase [Paeniglutamicibacter terrestris]